MGSEGMGVGVEEEAGGISILLALWYGDELVIEEVEVEGRGKGGRHWTILYILSTLVFLKIKNL
jgi:hypothetical protein